eukprot:TRINITY_DN11856_c0_g1_i12.p2 TRINITY_DN11856_c0_g1~~TRINITY_DN11856_c0_g1_i12.p2  ORF type:complete len:411 (+),score=56.03 TRINITY_DN11856_c0_g1_i12:110-1342(+)
MATPGSPERRLSKLIGAGNNTNTRSPAKNTALRTTSRSTAARRATASQAPTVKSIPIPHIQNASVKAMTSSSLARCFGIVYVDGTSLVWQAPEDTQEIIGKEFFHENRHRGPANACCFSPNGLKFVTAGADKRVVMSDTLTHQKNKVVLTGHERSVLGVAYASDGKLLASVSNDGFCFTWDPKATEKPALRIRAHKGAARLVYFSNDGTLLITSGSDNVVRIWSSEDGQRLRELRGHDEHITSCAFPPTGLLMATSSIDCTVRLWDAATGSSVGILQDHEKDCNKVVFSAGGRFMATCSADHSIILLDVREGRIKAIMKGHEGAVNDVCFSPDGSVVASCGDDQHIILWDTAGGNQLTRLSAHDAPVVAVAFSTDGTLIMSSDTKGVSHGWDLIPAFEHEDIDRSKCIVQ